MTDDNIIPFNPLDKRHLGESVGQAMLRQPITAMADLTSFDGAGIYAIYYRGTFPAYKTLTLKNQGQNFIAPIYVGKAVPKGARKGGDLGASPGSVLFDRLMQHKRSIEEASNLDIASFYCRYLIVDDIWIPLGESLLIANSLFHEAVIVRVEPNRAAGTGQITALDLSPDIEWQVKIIRLQQVVEERDIELVISRESAIGDGCSCDCICCLHGDMGMAPAQSTGAMNAVTGPGFAGGKPRSG